MRAGQNAKADDVDVLFVKGSGSDLATIDPAGSISTSLVGVSAGGELAGNYENSSSVNNGFVDNNGVITTIVIPGATDTGVSAINSAGEVVGYYADSLGNVHGFINQNGVTTTVDVPGATETDSYLVGNHQAIVLAAKITYPAQKSIRLHDHPRRPLHDWLDANSGNAIPMPF